MCSLHVRTVAEHFVEHLFYREARACHIRRRPYVPYSVACCPQSRYTTVDSMVCIIEYTSVSIYLSTTTGVLYGIGMVLHSILYYLLQYTIQHSMCMYVILLCMCQCCVCMCVSLSVCVAAAQQLCLPAYLVCYYCVCMYVCYTILHSMYVHRCMCMYTIHVCMYVCVCTTHYYTILLYIVCMYVCYTIHVYTQTGVCVQYNSSMLCVCILQQYTLPTIV